MKKPAVILCALIAFIALGIRQEPHPRCDGLALEIVKTWFENSPVLPPDIARERSFRRLGCPESLLELQRQRIINGEVEPWVKVHG